MTETFDPTKAVEFDLAHGAVTLRRSSHRVLVPADALAALCDAAGEVATAELGEAMGEALGMSISSRMEAMGGKGQEAVRNAPLSQMVDWLGGEVALLGLGCLSFERWGKAMIAVLDDNPAGAMGDGLFESLLASALTVASGREVGVVRVDRAGARARFLVSSPSVATAARAELKTGKGWGDVLVGLHGGGADGGGAGPEGGSA
jgi:hypothetical protein